LTFARVLALAASTAALIWVTVWGVETWWYQAELGRAGREMASGRYAPARARLSRLSARRPGRAEVEYPLGACEAALGHVGAALDAWRRVPGDAPEAPRAALDRANLALEHGRLAMAEESLAAVANAPGDLGDEAARLTDRLLMLSGRGREIARRIERRRRPARDQAAVLRTHWLADTQAFPVAAVREALERMSRENPDDDRVWLGRADLDTRTGRFAEADQWLRRCEARRPDDPDVWEARLAWALDAGRPDEAAQALTQLPADRFPVAKVEALRARLGFLRGDPAAERAALERRVELEPGDGAAWGRLAELAERAGERDRAATFRRRKGDVDRAKDNYRKLMGAVASPDPAPADELARSAEALGRRFEARGWWSLRARQAPGDSEARSALERLARTEYPEPAAGRTVADLLSTPGPPATDRRPGPAQAPAVPKFRDDAEAAGLRFVYDNDQSPLRRLPETMGGGVGLIDYNGDGFLDVYAVQGGRFPPGDAPSGDGDRLFRNKGDGTFEDVTRRAGIEALRRGFGHGVAVADYDNDGHPDLFVTRWGTYALYRNRGDGTFEDVTERSGLGGQRDWPTSAAFADLDGDGDLDLYVCHYLKWDPARSRPCPDADRPGSYLYCVPRAFEAEPDHVFRNDGGRFTDVTAEAGVVDLDGRGLGVVIADLDGDDRPDIFVANDMTANLLFRNLGGFRFEEVGEASGVASSGEGGYQAGMGIACGDLDGDGLPDLAVTNFYGESTTLFHNLGGGLFADRTAAAGLSAPSRYVLGFGAFFLDANNDGRLDLATANGHVNDFRPAIPYAMPAQLYLGTGGGRLAEVSDRAGGCWRVERVGRGMAVGDLDNDGRQDVVILAQKGPLAYFHNVGVGGKGRGGHFLTLQLEGTRSNRDAVGARVRVTASGRAEVAQRLGGGSFLSAGDGRLHFGLGEGDQVPRADVEIRWPSGRVDRYDGLPTDSAYHLVEGDARARPLKGWSIPADHRTVTQ
jgi:tetratricopeptide (TPR) repeat protein